MQSKEKIKIRVLLTTSIYLLVVIGLLIKNGDWSSFFYSMTFGLILFVLFMWFLFTFLIKGEEPVYKNGANAEGETVYKNRVNVKIEILIKNNSDSNKNVE
jgi:hypothetical protein